VREYHRGSVCGLRLCSGLKKLIFERQAKRGCEIQAGMTKLRILINTCRRRVDLLDTIAEECFHLYQDVLHGPGWRGATERGIVEGEAREFVSSRVNDIEGFLAGWDDNAR
jgi:hypothetical protein